MKKFLSMVMAAAMVVSLVPATAFAATGDFKATAKVVDAQNFPVDGVDSPIGGSELQMTLTTGDSLRTKDKMKFTVTLDNVKDLTDPTNGTQIDVSDIFVLDDDGSEATSKFTVSAAEFKVTDEDEFEFTVEEKDSASTTHPQFKRGLVIGIDLSGLKMDKVSKGKTATISIDSDDATITNGDDLVFASVEAKGIQASVKKLKDVAAEEYVTIEDLKLEPSVGSHFSSILKAGDQIRLKLNSGFEFTNNAINTATVEGPNGPATKATIDTVNSDNDEIIINITDSISADLLKVVGLEVEATTAKAGATATIRVYADGCDTVSVEVAKVVDYTVSMTVDEDEDVPVIYSGVDVDNTGITDDNDHDALEVTIKETFAGAWNNSKDFTLSLPEGVYIADEISTSVGGDFALKTGADYDGWFEDAYKEGDYVDLTFERRTWNETNPDDSTKDDPAEVSFTLKLVADPNFEGDVVLKLTGDAVEEQEVTIAKFVKPYTVEAQQNDLQIDYRNTEIPTSVVIKEAEAGLWAKDTVFQLALDKISFDNEGTIKVDEKSGLEIKDNEIKEKDGVLTFTIETRSDDEPATVTISGMELYMNRSLPAGAYDLDVWSPTMLENAKVLTNKDDIDAPRSKDGYLKQAILGGVTGKEDCIAEINDDFYDLTAKAGFVNIVTAGREDTESFTTKVVVPVGESYLISGENKVTIDVPAYINANGYTMLPLRAVAVALGINSENVLWDQASRTATVMYGSKIINMTYGQKVVYVNGSMIPATAAVEITNDRMFLGLRDLGNALGVTDITWDGATKTATLNGNK
nr:copper amine oxidase N-terminal domain-containing protein [uncultured Anaerotignum sp.]